MKQLESKSMVLLRHHLKVLRLPTFGAEAEKVAAQCARDDADHLTYLLQLCELELLERDKARRGAAAQGGPVPDVQVTRDVRLHREAERQQDARRRARTLRVHRQA